jgi:PAS domain S-box-containing protein
MTTDTPEWLYQHIVGSAPDAIIFADQEGVVRLWNAGAERIFGYSAAEAVGQRMDMIIPDRLRSRHWDGYERVMETGVTRYGTELLAVPALRKDGSQISIEFSISLPRDASGKPLGAVAIIRDVTDRWNQQRAQQKRLTELEAELQQLRNPTA